jgi:hypothetical protein
MEVLKCDQDEEAMGLWFPRISQSTPESLQFLGQSALPTLGG